ncbi:MAG: beta strand repeat-containing protein [Planctomycetales bacterium]
MRISIWQRLVDRLLGTGFAPARRSRRERQQVRLSLRRLEERCVLDAAAVALPNVQVTEGEGGAVVVASAPADGAADVFQILRNESHGKDLLQINHNGSTIYSQEVDKVASLTIHGNSDVETLVIDFGAGNPIPTDGIMFVGVAGAEGGDALFLNHGSARSIQYQLLGGSSGVISVDQQGVTSTIEFSGSVSSIQDTLTAASRTLNLGGATTGLEISSSVTTGLTQASISGGPRVAFSSPTERLSIADHSSAGGDFLIHGLGSGWSADLSLKAAGQSSVRFDGPVDLGSGNLHVRGGEVSFASSVTATGGMIDVSASVSVTVTSTGALLGRGGDQELAAPDVRMEGRLSSPGGTVRLDAGTDGTLIVSGEIDASSSTAGSRGGTVDLLGSRVGLIDHASVNVSGVAGGGVIYVGGGWQGADPNLANALRTYVGTDVVLRADATVSGQGGTVVLWSDEMTAFSGAILARGGLQGGDGGTAEVSSAGLLMYRGTTDLTASAGQAGTLLLDPLTITIVDRSLAPAKDDGQISDNTVLFGDTSPVAPPNNFTISEKAIEQATSNIVLQARNRITINALTSDGVLLLPIGRNITLQTRNNPLIGVGETSTGGITFANLANRIEARGSGTITLQAGTTAGSQADVSIGGLRTAGGAIQVSATRHLAVGGAVASNGGAVTLMADSDGNDSGMLTVNGGASVNTANGTLTLVAADVDVQAASTLNSAAGVTHIQGSTAAKTIDLGTDTPGSIGLTDAELDRITAGTLRIGRNDLLAAGEITVSAAISPGAAPILHLLTGAGVQATGAGTIATSALAISATGPVTLANANDVDTLATSAQSLEFQDADDLSLGTVDGLSGVSATKGDILVTAPSLITVNQGVAAPLGNVVLTSDNLALNAAVSGIVVTLRNATASRAINLGSEGAGELSLTDAELDRVTASQLNIGRQDGLAAGQITFTAAVTPLAAPILHLQTGAGVTDIVGGLIVNPQLAISALGAVALHNGNDVDLLAGVGTAFEFHDVDDLTIGLVALSNGVSGTAGDVQLTAETALTIDQQVQAVGGSVLLTADDQALNAQVAGAIVTLRNGTVNRSIDLGTQTPGALSLTDAELDQVLAQTLRIGRDDAAATGAITVSALIDPNGAPRVHLIAAGSVASTRGGALVVPSLAISTTGSVNLGQGNDVDQIAVSIGGAGESLTFRDVDDLEVGTVDSVVGVSTNNGDVLLAAGGGLTISEAVAVGTGTARLVASGNITQGASGAIASASLGVRQDSAAGGNVILTNAGNDVNTLAAFNAASGGEVRLQDADDLTIGAVAASSDALFAATTGVSTNNGDVLLDANGALAINNAIAAGTGTARLVADGDITQGASGALTAATLGVRQESAAGGNVILTNAGNDVNTLAAWNAFSGGEIRFQDADDLTIGSVSASSDALFAATSGVSTNNGVVLLDAHGPLTINNVIAAGSAAARLVAAGNITQGASGAITVASLGVRQESVAGGTILLTNAANDVNTLAAFNAASAGEVRFRDAGDLTVGSVLASSDALFTGTTGVSTNDGDVLLDAKGTLTINNPIAAGMGTARLVADGDITQGASGTITAASLGIRQESATGGNIILTNAGNDVNTLAVFNAASGGEVRFQDADDLTIGSVSASSDALFATTTGVASNNGDVLLDAHGPLTINNAVGAGTGMARLVAEGDITQGGAGTITGASLGIRQESATGGSIILTNSGNDVNTLAAFNAAAGAEVRFRDADDLTVGSVSASPDALFASTTGVATHNGNVLLDANGALSINEALAAGTGTARLVADGDITQAAAGTITAATLGIRQESVTGGNVILTNGGNDVNTLAALNAFSGGEVRFQDADDLTIGSVLASSDALFAATSGVATNIGDVLLDAHGPLTINNAVGAGTARFVADGDITQGASGAITAASVGIRQESATSGNIILTNAGNDVNTLAAANAAPGGEFRFQDADDLTIGAVSASSDALFAATSGVSTNNGDVLLNANGPLTINEALAAGTGTARLVADGDITQGAAGTITAAALGIRQESVTGGNIILTNVGNDVSTLAGFNAASGAEVRLQDANDLTIGAVAASADALFASTSGVATNNGDVLMDAHGPLTINNAIAAGTGTARLVADGDITQAASGTIAAATLGVRQESVTGGNIILTNAGNDVNTLAEFNTFSSGEVRFQDADDLTIGSVSTSSDALFAATSGVLTNNGDVLLSAHGSLTINEAVAAAAATVRLVAEGDITQSAAGAVTAASLGVRQESAAGGDIELASAGNDVDTLAAFNAFAGGSICFHDVDDLAIGTVSASPDGLFAATTGMSANNGDLVLNSSGPLLLDTPISAGTAAVRLQAQGDITQGATGTITAGSLAIRQEGLVDGDIVLTNSANDVDTLAAFNAFAGGTINYQDADDLVIGTVTADPECQYVATDGVQSLDGDVLLNAQGPLTINSAIGAGTGTTRLVAAGDITQAAAGTITVASLGVRQESAASGNIILTNAGNDVNTLAAFNAASGGELRFQDADELTIGAVAPSADALFADTVGVTTNNGDVLLDAYGSLTINETLAAGTGTARLVADGEITQGASGTITAASLGIRQQSTAAGNIILTNSGNDVNTLAAFNAAVGGEVRFQDADDLTIGAVAASADALFAQTTGVSTNNGDVLLDVHGPLTINNNVGAGTGTARLVAVGDITQGVSGTITAASLGVRQESVAGGNIILTNADNDLNTLAASNAASGGEVWFQDADDLTIGSVSVSSDALFASTTGVSTDNGNVQLNANGGLTINEAIAAGTGTARLVAKGDISQGASGAITAASLGVRQESAVGGNVILTNAANDVNTLAAFNAATGGEMRFQDADDLTFGAVAASADALFATTMGVATNNGDLLLDAHGPLTINNALAAGTGTARIVAQGDITQAAAGTITAASLGVRQESVAGGNVILTNSGNDVNTLAAFNAASGGEVRFQDADDLTIGSVSASVDALFADTAGVSTNNGDLLLDAHGSLTINSSIAAGTATARFVAEGNITQGVVGTITVATLGVRQESVAGGNIVLANAGNAVETLAAFNAFPGGAVRYLDADDLSVGAVSASADGLFAVTHGVRSTNGAVELTAGGTLSVDRPVFSGTGPATLTADSQALNTTVEGQIVTLQNLRAGRLIDLGTENPLTLSLTDIEIDRVTAATLRIGRNDPLSAGEIAVSDQITPAASPELHLRTGAGVHAEGGGAIRNPALAISAGGWVSLPNANDVAMLAAVTSNPGQRFHFHDVNDLVIGQVDGVVGLAQPDGDVILQVEGGATQQPGAAIRSDGLALTGAGTFTLTDPTNDVATLAAQTDGPINYRDANDLEVGTVVGTVGITTPGAAVSLRSHGSMTLSQEIVVPGGEVFLQSDAEGIVDGNGLVNNIATDRLALQAVQGIGSLDALETRVRVLAASNSLAGNVQISNVAPLLLIGATGGITGISHTGTGMIHIENNGALTVQALVHHSGGGDITLSTLTGSGDLMVDAPVYATGGSGNLSLFSGIDLLIHDTGNEIDLLTQNAGLITGIAQRHVKITTDNEFPNQQNDSRPVVVQTGTGAVTSLAPRLENVRAPQIGSDGIAHVLGDFGHPGARYFTIVVTWGDGTVDEARVYPGGPGSFDFTHFYRGNPDGQNQSAPIPVTVTVFDDPGSNFTSLGQSATLYTGPINETDILTFQYNTTIDLTFNTVPGEGIGFVRIDTTLHIPPLLFPSLTTLVYLFDEQPLVSNDSSNDLVAQNSGEEEIAQARKVLLVVVDPRGEEASPVELEESVLDDLPGFFSRLPDGHYRIYLKEVGEQRLRILLDFYIRGGKPSAEFEAEQDQPPGSGDKAQDAPVEDGIGAAAFRKDAHVASSSLELFVNEQSTGLTVNAISGTMDAPRGGGDAVEDEQEQSASKKPGSGALEQVGIGALAWFGQRGFREVQADQSLAELAEADFSRRARLARKVHRRRKSSLDGQPRPMTR